MKFKLTMLFKQKLNKIIISLVILLYIWTMPFLSKIGFCVKNEHSISGYIANAPATGAMAVLSYCPLNLMKEFQLFKVLNLQKKMAEVLDLSLTIFQLSYGLFLICTFHYVPNWLHFFTVFTFCLSFLVHTFLSLKYLQYSDITMFILYIGCGSLLFMPYCLKHEKYLWFVECIGLTCMFSFTPIEMLIQPNNNEYIII